MSSPGSNWSLDVFRVIQARNITLVCTVPDGGLTNLLDLIEGEDKIRLVTLSTEEEGIGIAAGCWLGGRRAMIAMQSSGVGNCINALGLPLAYRAPCLMLVTMRGHWGEFNPWQVPMGQAARPALEAMGVRCFPVERPEDVGETFAAAADLAFNSRASAAVLVSQRIIGAKGFGQK
ncbi:MAG: phosphonopyruvate decarboxylase [Hyphomicrobiaceae bacterium]|nr:phosphonopyruvate decarboxylase [Hyphomicrobiaceae bacterium]